MTILKLSSARQVFNQLRSLVWFGINLFLFLQIFNGKRVIDFNPMTEKLGQQLNTTENVKINHLSVFVPPMDADIICPPQGVHSFQHSLSLQHYNLCINGKATVIACPDNLYFDHESSECREMGIFFWSLFLWQRKLI